MVGFAGVDSHGLEGIERRFDKELAGEPRAVQTLRDARGNPVLQGAIDSEEQTSGADIYLTIDLQIQHAAEAVLERAIERTRAKSASAVVLDVDSANILAMAVQPRFQS